MRVKLLAFEVAGVTYRPEHAQLRAEALQPKEELELERELEREPELEAVPASLRL